MGVNGLLGLLKSIHKPTSIKHFQGKIIGVDAYGWLHRGAVACAIELAQGKPTSKYVDFAMHRVRMLRHFGAVPYLVFDGDRLPSKARTERDRASRRRDSRASGLELLRMGRTAQAYQELQKAVDITPEMARELIEVLRHEGVKYVVAPYEADSQLVYLEKKGMIDAILSEDSDMLVFGAKCLLTKLDQYGECVMIRQDDFTACREVSLTGWTTADLRMMCILNGCDYLEGIHKLGLKTAHRLIRKYKTIEKLLRALQLEGKFKIPERYIDDYRQAEMTFLYQWVFCPEGRELVNLNKPEYESQLDGISYIGQHFGADIARGVALGDLNPMTKEPIMFSKENIVRHLQRTPTLSRSKSMGVENDSTKNKSITNFFKPNRAPLAELDPNSLKPSVVEQSWVADPAPRRPQSALLRSSTDSNIPHLQRAIASAPQANKRQRLCSDDRSPQKDVAGNVKVERSRFFSSNLDIGPLPVTQPTRKKKRVNNEFNIWSDDSIEEAMASMPEQDHLDTSTQKSNESFTVFKDSKESSNEPQVPHNDLEQEKLVSTVKVNESTPLNSALLDEAEELRLGSINGRTLKVFDSSKYFASATSGSASQVVTTESTGGILKTPRPLQDSSPPAVSSRKQSTAALVEASPLGRVNKCTEYISTPTQPRARLQIPEPVPMKGSEDCIVPDSDAGSEIDFFAEDDRVPTSSPLRAATPSSNAGGGRTESDEETTPRPVLNLSRFTFTGGETVRAR